ncbi:MAG TPA: hypothetical protein VIJ59_04695 [Caulobacteraceae bacterium]
MKLTLSRAIASLCLLTLGACTEGTIGPTYAGPGTARTTPYFRPSSGEVFNEGDFAWSRAPGVGAIDGVVTFHDGDTRYSCGGRDVILTPETPWVRRRMFILYGSVDGAVVPADIVRARTPSGSSGDYASYARKTTCDATNRFTFRDLPAGGWYVITLARPLDVSQGAVAIMRRVQVGGSERTVNLD